MIDLNINQKGFVYFIYFEGELAYIGCSKCLEKRLTTNYVYLALKSFGKTSVEKIDFEKFKEAFYFEQKVIARLNPPFNKVNNPDFNIHKLFVFLIKHLVSLEAILCLMSITNPIRCGLRRSMIEYVGGTKSKTKLLTTN